VAPVHPGIGVAIIQPSRMAEVVVESPASSTCSETGISGSILRSSTILQIENTNLRVPCARYDRSVAGVRHKLDTEDIGMVARAHTRIEGEGFCQVRGVEIPDIQICVITTGGEEVAAFGPTVMGQQVADDQNDSCRTNLRALTQPV
jgi:hypothetical protein